MRKLASIQYIHDITPIAGADRIELAHVLGWQVTAQKGQFHVGDRAVYFEIDSFLPLRPEFEFLRKTSYKNSPILGEGFRLRTMKFRGEISQGLLMSPDDFPELKDRELPIGMDVTEALGVRKWEIEERATNGGTIIGEFCGPSIQSNRLKLSGPEWYIFTVMVDGRRQGLREMQDIAKALGNPTVPVEETGMDFDEKYPTVEAVLARADGFHPNGARKEGIVIRPTEPVFNYEISAALSMKAVSNKYLLKTDG